MTSASRPPRMQIRRAHPRTESDTEEVIPRLNREREQHAHHKDPKRLERSEAFRPHDTRDNTEDRQRHDRNDPVQNLDERFQEELDEMSDRSKRPLAFLAERHAKRHGDEDDTDHLPIVTEWSQQALGHILKKEGRADSRSLSFRRDVVAASVPPLALAGSRWRR